MVNTFRPLELGEAGRAADDGKCVWSWVGGKDEQMLTVPADALNARTRAGVPMAPRRTEPPRVHAYRPAATSGTDLGGRSGSEPS